MNTPENKFSVESDMDYATEAEALAKAQQRVTKYAQDYYVTKAVKLVKYPVPTNEVVDLS